jgi:hypothetical protein
MPDSIDASPAGPGYRPPAPVPQPTILGADNDLLERMSAAFYTRTAIRLRGIDRNVLIINEPDVLPIG